MPTRPRASLFPHNADDRRSRPRAGRRSSGYVHPFDRRGPDPTGTDAAHERAAGRRRARQGGLLRGRRLQRSPATAGVWYRLLNCGFRMPDRGRHRRDGELRVAARPGRHEPRVRRARAPKLDDRAWLAALKAGQRPSRRTARCSSFTLDGARGRRRDRAAGRRARRSRRSVSLRSIAPVEKARDRLERRRRRDVPLEAGGTARTRRSPCPVGAERLVHAARLVGERGRAGPRHLSLRDDEPDLRPRRRRARSAAPPTRSTSSRGSLASRRPRRRTADGTTRRKRRKSSSASPPRRRSSRSGRTKRLARPASSAPRRAPAPGSPRRSAGHRAPWPSDPPRSPRRAP